MAISRCGEKKLRHGPATAGSFTRGLDHLFTPFNYLDLTVYGRQEEWEDSPEGWPRRPAFG